ncbi:MAG TPA: hypothetical protein VHO01_09285 [Jatrophihabitans sp.]|nr:hypothetical protein [Jatrophihabitans sp.]
MAEVVDPSGREPAGRPLAPGVPDVPLSGPLLALGYLLFAAAGLLAAVFTVLLVPLRVGATLLPVAPVLAVLTGVGLPALSRGLTDTLPSALPPALGQVVGTWVLGMGRPEGDVLLPAGSTAGVSYSVLILGTLLPLFTVGLASRPGPWTWSTVLGRLRRVRRADQQAAEPRYVRSRRAGRGSGSDGAR